VIPNPLAEDEPAVVDALGLLARHLRAHAGMVEPDRIEVDRSARRLRCQVLASPGWELATVVAWADSLPGSVVKASRAAVGALVVATVRGCTVDGLPLEVYSGLPYRRGLFRPLPPGGTRAVSRGELFIAAIHTAGAARAAQRRPGGGAR
jgi:hypothetical protein